MTLSERQNEKLSVNYYPPNPTIAAFLASELQNLKKNENVNVAGKVLFLILRKVKVKVKGNTSGRIPN